MAKSPGAKESQPIDQSGFEGVLESLLEAWGRNNTVMLNLLHVLPEGGLQARATANGPTVAQQFTHLCHERLISVYEEAPEYARKLLEDEWADERDRGLVKKRLLESAEAVREAVGGRIMAGRELDLNYGHPALLLQMLLWHEGYHHGQMKLALKLSGCAIPDKQAGPLTWDVWRERKGKANG